MWSWRRGPVPEPGSKLVHAAKIIDRCGVLPLMGQLDSTPWTPSQPRRWKALRSTPGAATCRATPRSCACSTPSWRPSTASPRATTRCCSTCLRRTGGAWPCRRWPSGRCSPAPGSPGWSTGSSNTGLIQRVACPNDARVSYAQLTDTGLREAAAGRLLARGQHPPAVSGALHPRGDRPPRLTAEPAPGRPPGGPVHGRIAAAARALASPAIGVTREAVVDSTRVSESGSTDPPPRRRPDPSS